MEEKSGGIKMDKNPSASCGDPRSDNRKVFGLLYGHNVLG